MIREILTESGVTFAHSRFLRTPAGTYAVYFENRSVDGPDTTGTPVAGGTPRIIHHNVTVELYEPAPDDASEAAIEAALDARGLLWTKEDRVWLPTEQLYQVVFEFSHTTKI